LPYRIDLSDPPADALETLIDLGALDVESVGDGVAALMPDTVPARAVARELRVASVRVSAAVGRDDASVWTLSPPRLRTRTLLIQPANLPPAPGAIRMIDGSAFGTGLHPTTSLCLEVIEDLLDVTTPARLLDVGTGSGILALAALRRGVPRAIGVDVDIDALAVAAGNARLNDLSDRCQLIRGGVDAVSGSWSLVVANIRAAELMELAPQVVRRMAHGGRLVLSGIPSAVGADVDATYRRLGMQQVSARRRAGWTALVLQPSW